MGSVNVNDTAGNAFQLDVNFRGFTASPALGTPQGLSVFVDGVRVNEVFGDTVNWDLIPEGAIAKIAIVPGSNPVFGLNTLGGALSVTTRDGFDEERRRAARLRRARGADKADRLRGRRATTAHLAAISWRATCCTRTGWGDHDPSRRGAVVRRRWAGAAIANRVDLSLSLANTRLEGNQTLPLTWLSDYRHGVFLARTSSRTSLVFLNANASHRFDARPAAGGATRSTASLKTYVFNSNVNDDFDHVAGRRADGNQPTGNAINDVAQSRSGASMQLSVERAAMAGHANHLSAGASFESGFTAFTQSSQEAGSIRATPRSRQARVELRHLAACARVGRRACSPPTRFGSRRPHTFLNVAGRYNVAQRGPVRTSSAPRSNGRHTRSGASIRRWA